jgi:hypothetical protein
MFFSDLGFNKFLPWTLSIKSSVKELAHLILELTP